jgi:ubiquinone/menaquinone biosynthesis C-methylase UbiE
MTSREQFDRQAAHYDEQWATWNRASLEWMLERAAATPDWHVLDVATGSGYTAAGFAPLVREVVGIDVSPGMLEQARAKGLPNARFEEGSAESIPFPAASFDLVTCRIAPHHFASVPAFLSESRRVLKPGGLLLIADTTVPDDAPDVDAWQNQVERLRDPSHQRNHTPAAWRSMVESAGFAVEELALRGSPVNMTLEDWLTKAGCKGKPAEQVRELFRTAPASAQAAFRIEPRGTDFGFAWLRVVIAARA